ncbi:GNAT family N-acetyltransferase [Salipiger thiooxidans]|uniref:GNAT family N-acetyltransferase n=1 Tax=Salipiger thiooxidans TaxID=282683 RepID=UPI001CD5F7F4|nr:GNAT family N-acetyltransferase [Salipiger thiooxidans]MCA0851450.1 GNAT family N-acetyltransferase [Salipiger thiooxidans]
MTRHDRPDATEASPPGINIRMAELSDLDALAPLFVAFFAEDGISTEPAAIRVNLDRMLQDDRACFYVAETEAGIVGMSSGSLIFGVEFGCAAEVEYLYVAPIFRGRGFTRMLMNRVLQWAGEQGASEIILVITAEAERTQGLTRFYESFGFGNSQRITMYQSALRLALPTSPSR